MQSLAQNLASSVVKVVSTTKTTTQQHIEGELNLFTLSDQKILELIYTTHVHADDSFDEDSLFVIVENILKYATQIVDKIIQVYIEPNQEMLDFPDTSCSLTIFVFKKFAFLFIMSQKENFMANCNKLITG